MIAAPGHPQEAERLAQLRHYSILDSEPETSFDELVELASELCGTSISLISLVDTDRQWFKAKVGLEADETHRDLAFCGHAILQGDVFEVPDASQDPRFSDNPLVTSAPDIRFYAGAPLVAPNGLPLGTLCVIDQEPKKLTRAQCRALQILANQAVTQIELRLHNQQLQVFSSQSQAMLALLGHDLREPFNSIMGLSQRLASSAKSGSDRTAKAAQSVFDASLRAFSLVEDVLTWAKSELSSVPAAAVALSPAEQVGSAVEFCQAALDAKSLTVICELDEDVRVMGQSALMQAVLRNLFANAVKYSPEGGVLTLSAEACDEWLELRMHNAGSVIPKQVEDKLFASPCESQAGSQGEVGNGIGMYLCQRFLERQGGRLWLAQNDEAGVSFAFTLPLHRADDG